MTDEREPFRAERPYAELLEEADWLFRRVVRRFVKERDRISVEGVSLPGLLILQKIIREGEQRLGDLAEELDFTSGAVTALCDKLEREGLAVRRRKEEDRRSVTLDITPQGREMVRRNRNIGSRCAEVLFSGVKEPELIEQIEMLHRMMANLGHYSETINALAKENAEAAASGREPEDESVPGTGRFLTY
ncbi:MarR family transcriptional regulator [Cohnella sp. CIP 111063]|jgi:DNA-binding MarR family transcriptional regulator|uniref:MarR family winged helix-turn-helix transcriptional regulator n=1 Tax=unclassified Cohnella TaxID=2636738 RepID=UPI000B8BD79D|nr:MULTISPECIES: MarR family transcriptional regulator [unclassified Cohnella]OXS55285.1 MarR family transcriptional regulator [Cohnella sp. CIP 111063]PRX65710.1 MarR family transcriptional regulator [Cohnella sp. SGD-V74]